MPKTATKTATDIDQRFIDAGLEQLVPDPVVEEAYINRTIKGWTDFDYFDAAKDLLHNVIQEGPTGAGKTMSWRAMSARDRKPLAVIEFAKVMDPMAAFGKRDLDDKGNPIFVQSPWVKCYANGGNCGLDEVSLASGFTAAFHGGLDGRGSLTIPQTGEVIPRHEETHIFSAYNPKYRNTTPPNQAFLNRFAFPIEWGYDPEVEEQLIGAYSPTLLETVRRLRADTKNIITDIGTNAMDEFIQIANRLDIEAAVYLFTNKVTPSERMMVGTVMEAESHNIAGELGLQVDQAGTDTDEDE